MMETNCKCIGCEHVFTTNEQKGKMIKCPKCSGLVSVFENNDKSIEASKKENIYNGNGLCPFCAENISPEAKKCKHCGEWLVGGAETLNKAILNSSEKKSTISVGLIFSAILVFLISIFWFFIAYTQADYYLRRGDDLIAITSIWNFFMALAYIAIGIGILKLKKWGYDWAIGSALLNIFLQGYQVYNLNNSSNREGAFIMVFIVILQIVTLILLIVNRKSFPESEKKR